LKLSSHPQIETRSPIENTATYSIVGNISQVTLRTVTGQGCDGQAEIVCYLPDLHPVIVKPKIALLHFVLLQWNGLVTDYFCLL
jgi:hypothetical protein